MKKYTLLLLIFLSGLFTNCNQTSQESTTSKNEESKKENEPEKILNVAVFKGDGAGVVSDIETIEALRIDKEINAYTLTAAEIMQGKLENTDVLIFPGGSGSKQVNNLGKLGQQKVKEFINNGKAAIGICAGAYMFCSTEGYPSLQIASVKHLDRPHYARGRGLIEFSLNKKGEKIFPELTGKKQFIQYYDGPILEAMNQNPTQLATYVSDIHANKGTPVDFTPGKLFIYYENIGKGKIFAIGGHAESTPGMRWMIPRMARFVSGSKIVSYNDKWIHPEINTKEIIFDNDLKKVEKELWWQLFDPDPNKQIEAMNRLHALRSRPFVRWNIGLLRDDSPKVRANAAKIMRATEYTYAIPDLQAALQVEKDNTVKNIMKNALKELKNK